MLRWGVEEGQRWSITVVNELVAVGIDIGRIIVLSSMIVVSWLDVYTR